MWLLNHWLSLISLWSIHFIPLSHVNPTVVSFIAIPTDVLSPGACTAHKISGSVLWMVRGDGFFSLIYDYLHGIYKTLLCIYICPNIWFCCQTKVKQHIFLTNFPSLFSQSVHKPLHITLYAAFWTKLCPNHCARMIWRHEITVFRQEVFLFSSEGGLAATATPW